MHQLRRWSGFFAVVTVWIGIIVAILRAPLNLLSDQPISSLGTNSRTSLLFAATLILSSVWFVMFALYLRQKMQAHVIAPVSLIIGQVAQVLVALAPYNVAGATRYIHVAAAYMVAISLPLSMYLYAKTSRNNYLKKLTMRFFVVELSAFVLGLGWFIFAPTAGGLAEITTAVVFDVWVLTIGLKLLQ